jgi:hypothetical protein
MRMLRPRSVLFLATPRLCLGTSTGELEREIGADIQHLFQKVVKTVEGVKSDAIFSYLPPLNILAFIFLTPLSYVCSPRTLHTINVFCIRLTVCPP